MEEKLLKKLISPTECSKNKLLLIKFSNKMKCSILVVLLKVKELLVLLKDSVSNIYKKKHIEVIEESDVLEDGILPELDLPLPELVNLVITLELKLTKKFIESEKDLNQTMLLLLVI